jgi:putative ABC transport system substrate-binding protein
VRRRQFVVILGGAALIAQAGRSSNAASALPLIGFVRATTKEDSTYLISALRRGLEENGQVEGKDYSIAYRFADNQLSRLPALIRELIAQRPAVLVAGGLEPAMEAKRATSTVPIVFAMGADPIRSKVVSSLSRPEANVTGVTFIGSSQVTKQLQFLHELTGKLSRVAFFYFPDPVVGRAQLEETTRAAEQLGLKLMALEISNEADLEKQFTKLANAGPYALQVAGNAFFYSRRNQIVNLAARYRIPACYSVREFVQAGGLMSYGGSLGEAYRQTGNYVSRILKGAKPSELPIQQTTKFELVVNRRTAKALGLSIPQNLLIRADEVIE